MKGMDLNPGPVSYDRTTGNELLDSLSPEDLSHLTSVLEPRKVSANEILYNPGDDVRFVYFPCESSMISFRVAMRDAPDIETVLVGREGAVGGIVSQGRLPAFARAVVQFPGPILRIRTDALEEAKRQSPALRQLFARYADCLLAQIFQSVACNAAHTIEQRTARWLMCAVERTGNGQIALTQEQLAGMLGVGRTYVNRIVQSLKTRGVLQTSRGRIKVVDRHQLHALACDCDEKVRQHFETVLGDIYPDCGPDDRGGERAPSPDTVGAPV